MTKYTIYTTAFHGGGVEYKTRSLRAALQYRSGSTSCECGCRNAPIWTSQAPEELEAELAKAGLEYRKDDVPYGGIRYYVDAAGREARIIIGEPQSRADECVSPHAYAK